MHTTQLIDRSQYPVPLRALLPAEAEMELAAGQPRKEMRAALTRFDLAARVAPQKIVHASSAAACHAGLWLAHNFLDQSHQLSQTIETPTGSFWHAIMHRREGDYDNACYWFRRVREHEAYPPLYAAATQAADTASDDRMSALLRQWGRWDSMAFVDLVRRAVAGQVDATTAQFCRQMARLEWEALFDHGYRQARGV